MAYKSFDIPESVKGWLGKKETPFTVPKSNSDIVELALFEKLPTQVNRSNVTAGITNKGANLWRKRSGTQMGWQFMPVTLDGIELWEPIIRAVGRKTIVETPLVERAGSVKEIISCDDWIINIRGTIKRPDGSWPDDEIDLLKDMRKSQKALKIISGLTSILLDGNDLVVMTNLSFPESPGFTQSVQYEIECISDIPFTLEIDNSISTVTAS